MNVFECPFSTHVRKTPKKGALIDENIVWTYEDCEKLIVGISQALKEEGVKEGDPIAFLPTKTFETPLLFFALFRIGAIACPVNTYHPLNVLPQTLDALGAPFFLYPSTLLVPKVKQITLPFSKIVREGKVGRQAFLNKKDRATYLSTSGTTATPKIACHSLGNHYYSALGSNAYMPINEGDLYALSLPLYHIAGIALLFRTFLAGQTVSLSQEAPGVTHLSLIPTQLRRLLQKETLPQYKHILLGGASIPLSLYQEGIKRGLPIRPTYGMTEMSSQVCTLWETSSFSMGHPLTYREIKIAKDGEILVKGKTLFQGYLKGDHTLELPLDKEGFFATHDLGSYSKKVGLNVHGRKDRLFISGGENIQPEEIEKLLKSIEGITDAQVIPTPDEEFGFRPMAYIQSEKIFEEEKLKDYLGSFLPKFKVPVKLVISNEIAPAHKEQALLH